MPTPYEVSCRECGEKLTLAHRSMDRDGDVFVEVFPCENCMEKAADAARDEAQP